MRMSGPEMDRLKILSFASLFLAIASTVFLSVLAIQINAHIRVGSTAVSSSSAAGPSQLIGHPVSSTILAELAGVSPSTLSAVGKGPTNVTSPAAIPSSVPLLASGRPEVLYIGGDFCPFCAAERWPLIVALSKFGNFSGLEYMISSSTDTYPDTRTFTFAMANYTSAYLTFVPVESQNRTHATVRPLTANQSALYKEYDSTGSIPFVDFGNKHLLVGSQFSPTVLRTGGSPTGSPYNWTTIASQLSSPNGTIAQNIDGAANRLISAICDLTSGQPASICSQGFAKTLGYFQDSRSPSNILAYTTFRRLEGGF